MATKTDKKRLHPIAIRLDDDMLDQLRTIAVAEHRPMANLIVAVLKNWLAERRAPQK